MSKLRLLLVSIEGFHYSLIVAFTVIVNYVDYMAISENLHHKHGLGRRRENLRCYFDRKHDCMRIHLDFFFPAQDACQIKLKGTDITHTNIPLIYDFLRVFDHLRRGQ